MQSVFANIIYTGTSLKKDMYLLFEGGVLKGFSKKNSGKLLGRYKVITPAFIDPHSHIGMIRAGEPASEAEINEQLDSFLPLLDPLDSLQMDDPSFEAAIAMGVLYSCIVPGSSNILGGHSAVIRHYAPNSSEALISRAGIKVALGYNPISKQEWHGNRPSTRMGAMAILRKKLSEIKNKKTRNASKNSPCDFSPEDEVLLDVIDGKNYLRVHSHKTDDIAALLRLADEFNIKVTIEHAMAVTDPAIFQELRRRKIAVTYGPIDAFRYKVELKNAVWQNINNLIKSRVNFGLMTDHPFVAADQLLIQSRWLLHAGFSKKQAIELLTFKNAQILGINSILGSLTKGKWASFTCWPGDPFDLGNIPQAVFGEGCLLNKTN